MTHDVSYELEAEVQENEGASGQALVGNSCLDYERNCSKYIDRNCQKLTVDGAIPKTLDEDRHECRNTC